MAKFKKGHKMYKGVEKGWIKKGQKLRLGIKHTKESKEKLSRTRKTLGIAKGEKNNMFGKTHSLEARRKIAESKKGKIPWNKGAKFLVGDKNPNWKGGIANKLNILRHTPEYYEWRKLIYKRDNFECQICGTKGNGNLNANHIKRFVDYPDLRHEPNNGITLCIRCHREIVTGHETEWESYFNFNIEVRRLAYGPSI